MHKPLSSYVKIHGPKATLMILALEKEGLITITPGQGSNLVGMLAEMLGKTLVEQEEEIVARAANMFNIKDSYGNIDTLNEFVRDRIASLLEE